MGVENNDKLKLYVRLPVRIKDELQVKELSPLIIAVHLPRQKSRRWCIVEFANEKDLEEVSAALKKKRIKRKRIVVGPYQKGTNSDEKDLSVSGEVLSSTSVLDLLEVK